MNAASTSRRPIALAALAIALLALGVGLRFYRLGAKSLWLDEAQTLFYVDRPLGETLAAERARDAHPPLYYALLHLWMGGSSCEARARAFSALASTLTLVVFFDLARRLLGIGAALMAAGVLAVSAFQVYFAQEARHYALATLWVTLAWWFLVLLLKRGKGRAWPLWLGLAVANTAALYTFYYTLFAIVAQGAFLLVAWRERGRRLLPRWLVCQAAVGAALAPYVPVVLARARQLRELMPGGAGGADASAPMAALFEPAVGSYALLMSVVPAWARLPVFVAPFLAVIAAVIAVTCVGIRGAPGRRTALEVKLGLAWLVVPVLCVVVFPFKGHSFEAKHLAFCAPALALLMGAGLSLEGRARRWTAGAATMFLVALNVAAVGRYIAPCVQKSDWRQLVAVMAPNVREGDVVLFNPSYIRLPFTYYYKTALAAGRGARLTPVDAPLPRQPFHLDSRLLGHRVWHVEASSAVAIPHPKVARALQAYERLVGWGRYGRVGRLWLSLHDLSRPASGTAQPAPQ